MCKIYSFVLHADNEFDLKVCLSFVHNVHQHKQQSSEDIVHEDGRHLVTIQLDLPIFCRLDPHLHGYS